jgi:AraC-like DNA-binding protein
MTFEHIQEKEQHLICSFYEKKENPLIEVSDCQKDSLFTRNSETVILAALLEGSIEFATGFDNTMRINKGRLFLVGKGTKFTIRFLEESCLIFFKITKEVDFCMRVQKSTAFLEELKDSEMITLEINSLIHSLLKQFIIAYKQGLRCEHYLSAKLTELIVLINAFYPLDMVTQFFLPLFSQDVLFKTTILTNKNKIFNVAQYAKLTYHTVETFRNHFKLIFHKTPKQWIEEEREKLIFYELTKGNKSLKEIADLSGFNSETEFLRFCKKRFDKTAMFIRTAK